MGTWNSRGLRGASLENIINISNEIYRDNNLALVFKIPTPITPMKIDKEKKIITLAYFTQKSCVDYVGNVQGVPICFDAKECAYNSFSLANIHLHQYQFMEDFEKQNGISFLIINFTKKNESYYIPFKDIKKFIERKTNEGKKSFSYDEIDKSYIIPSGKDILLHYLIPLSKDINSR